MGCRYLKDVCLLARVLAFLLLAAIATTDAMAQDARLQTTADPSKEDQSRAALSERRLRAEGLVFALGKEVEIELWVESRSLADLIADSYATDYRIPRASVPVPDVPYRVAVLDFDGRGFLRSRHLDEASPQDDDRIWRCLQKPLYSPYRPKLPCDRLGSACWEDLGEGSTALGSRLFPLQLAIFLENAGYSVYIGGLWLPSVLEALETGNMPIWPVAIRPNPLLPPPRQPRDSFTMDDIRLLPCEPVEE